jgi:hypothetical protein
MVDIVGRFVYNITSKSQHVRQYGMQYQDSLVVASDLKMNMAANPKLVQVCDLIAILKGTPSNKPHRLAMVDIVGRFVYNITSKSQHVRQYGMQYQDSLVVASDLKMNMEANPKLVQVCDLIAILKGTPSNKPHRPAIGGTFCV